MSVTLRNPSMLILLPVALLALLSHPCIGSDYYVKPSEESKCPSDAQPCKTLDEYANNTQDFEGDIRLLFLAGVHGLSKNITFSRVGSVQMIPMTHRTKVKIQILYSKYIMLLKVDASSGLTIENIDISGNEESATVIGTENTQLLSIHSVNFYKCSLLFRRLQLSDTDSLLDDGNVTINVTIQDSVVEQSGQTGVRLINIIHSNSVGPALNLTIANTTIARHQQGGIIFETTSTTMVTIADSTIEENQLPILQNGQSAGAAVGFGIYTTWNNTIVTIRNSHFVRNQDFRGQPMVVFVSGAKGIDVFDSEFRDNRGTAIRLVNIIDSLRLYGNVVFHSNTGQQGGALSFATLQTQAKLHFMPGLHVTFENNHAEDVGGAIYVEITWAPMDTNSPGTSAQCFYKFSALRSPPVDYSISFTNNSAKNGGNHVYGASLMCYCLVYNSGTDLVSSSDQEIRRYFHFDSDTVSPVSSSPYRACIIDADSPTRLSHHDSDCLNIFQHTVIAFPGLEFSLDVVLVGDEFGISAGILYAQILPNKTMAQIHPLLQTNPPQVMNYQIYSKNSHEVLVLTATNEKIVSYGDTDQMNQDIEEYYSTGVIPPDLLITPVYVNVHLLNCPTGYYFNHVTLGCVCNPKLCDGQITKKFSNGSAILYNITENLWINDYNNNVISGIIYHYNCPFDYCKITTKGLELTTPNSQCAMSHAGILCGKCAPGLTLALGSNNCLPCSNNNHLALLIFFAAAGFLLVFFIKILSMTVSQGTINGLIFYANIMWAYQSIFFSQDEDINIGKLWFLKTFVAWINLDFGIEMCFVQGLTAYIKTWLQFVFPFYVWSIAGVMILLASCSEKMTKLQGNNSVQVLATLFLLSYAKLLRTTITALMPATLYVFADNGEPIANQTQLVWAFDGNLLYGRVPHIFLLMFALLVLIILWLPYTFILLFIQPLRSGSGYRCLEWVNRQKPFLEAYTGPLNDKSQFWVGLLLLARFILLLTFTLTYSSNPSASVLALVMTIVLLLTVLSYIGQVYNNPTEFDAKFLPEKVSFRSILEISCLVNLVAVGGCILYLDSVSNSSSSAKTSVVYASVAFTFLQFIGIVTYHLYACCSPKSWKRLIQRMSQNENKNSEATMPILTTTISIDTDELASNAADYHSTSDYGSMLNTGSSVAMIEATHIADTY